MSFFKIQYENKQANISTRDVLNLHLTSIAHMEAGLAKLMDGEAEEIRLVSNCNPCYKDVLSINKSINRVLKNITKLQMLLQFKFDCIRHMPAGLHVSDISGMADGPDMSDMTNISAICHAPDTSCMTNVPDMANALDTPDMTNVLDMPDVPDTSCMTDVPDMANALDTSDMTNVHDMPDARETANMSDMHDASDTSNIPGISDGLDMMPVKTALIGKNICPDASDSDKNKTDGSINQDAISHAKKDASVKDQNKHPKYGRQDTEKMPHEKPEASSCKTSRYLVHGRGVGTVSNPKDFFYNGIAIVQAFIHDKDIYPVNGAGKEKGKAIENNDIWKEKSFLHYSVHMGTFMQIIAAYSSGLKMERHIHEGVNMVKVEGIGTIIHKERFKPDILDGGSFTLKIWFRESMFTADSFQMIIKAGNHPEFSHDSGKVNLKGANQSLGFNISGTFFQNNT